jgi:nucleotide-binding universal stress UspA family protein
MGFVVVGVDGSQMSTRALVWAMRYAKASDHRVVAITGFVIPWTIFLAPTYQPEDYAHDAERMLEQSVEHARAAVPGVAVEARLVQERPSVALSEGAHGAELLVVGARGHGALPDVHIGSVANACVNHAPCSVVVYRNPQGPDID